jgi:hypothetical protein
MKSFDKSIHHSNNVAMCPSNNYPINSHTFDYMEMLRASIIYGEGNFDSSMGNTTSLTNTNSILDMPS